ncbi:MAG: RecQ family ATP-dependent DNA helicase [bacterium]
MLRDTFGHSSFLPGQEQILDAVHEGRDCVAVLPTGGGKSLCFQLPAVLGSGVTLVVSPLIALMKDQVDSLVALGVPATFINSSLTAAEMNQRLDGMAQGRYRLVYVAPERFRNSRFLQALAGIDVTLFVVDEAHCISAWGHDFRPDYLRLAEALTALDRPQVMALTATATPEVREDIVTQLGLDEPAVIVSGFARPGLSLAVRRVSGQEDKFARVRALLAEYPTGIVYCATRRNVERVARRLANQGVTCVAYHGGLPEKERRFAQDRFMHGEATVAVATNAFGMGIDRSDLRCVIHWDLPGSLEAYYQEAGRAGRDGEPARCELLFNFADVRTQEFFIEGANPPVGLVRAVARHLGARFEASAEPIPVTAAEIASALDAPNEMAIGTALGLLDRAGYLTRHANPEAGTTILETVNPEVDLGEPLSRLGDKLERDRARLRLMLRYVDRRGCRHGFILRYFGDPAGGDDCGRCDNCQRRRGEDGIDRREPTETEWIEIQKILSCVVRLRGRFGRARIAQVLAGSQDKAVLKFGLDRIRTYGALADRKQPYIKQLLDALLDAGCLQAVGDEYPTLAITEFGGEVLHRREMVLLELEGSARPESPFGPASPARAIPPLGDEPGVAGDVADSALFLSEDCPSPVDLVEALRRWRLELARERGVPAYHILSNRVLEAVARVQPRSEAELLTVKGIGQKKLEEFGKAILRISSER